jgi:transmembrane sensor
LLQINTDSLVEVSYSNTARNIHLSRGEGVFKVTRDNERPFTVSAEDAHIQSLGTEFGVRLRGSKTVSVSVLEGLVHAWTDSEAKQTRDEVPPGRATTPDSHSGPHYFRAGQIARIHNGHVVSVADIQASVALAWLDNHLVFQNDRLADIVAEFNRYNKVQIHLEGKSVEERRLSGTFNTNDYEVILKYARKVETLVVVPDGRNWIIRERT